MTRRRTRTRRPIQALALGLLFLLGGCDGDSDILPTEVTLDRQYVTGAAAEALDANGRFVLTTAAGPPGASQITQAQAVALAAVHARYYLPSVSGTLERAHGAKIDFEELSQCGRVPYAASPYEPLAPTVPHWVRVTAGPQWIVTLCGESRAPQVALAVSAYATNVRIGDRLLIWDTPGGNEFFPSGIPPGIEIPVAPERAAEMVALATGRRVAEVPQLIIPAMGYTGLSARWKLVLESSAKVRELATGAELETTELYVGRNERARGAITIFASSPGLGSVPERFEYPAEGRPEGPRASVVLVRRQGVPRSFSAVSAGGQP